MKRTRNVLRDTKQPGYPPDLGRMFVRASNVVPMARTILQDHPEICKATCDTFYKSGLYFHLDDNNPSEEERAAVYQTLAVWGAALVTCVSEATVIDCAWIRSQGPEFDIRRYEEENVPPNCGMLVLTRPPKWDPEDPIALFADKVLWSRKGRPAFATIISGSLKKYPHCQTTLSNSLTDINGSISTYDPSTGLFRVPPTKKAPKR